MKPDAVIRLDESIDDLALFGGAPSFREVLHVGRPNIGDRAKLMARIEQMLDSRWLSNAGPFVRELEKRIAEMVGVKHCIVMCNATVALEITTRALGLTGEVILPSFTFVATAHALQWQKITPVFCDIDPATHTIDPAKVERMITPRTTGIIGVHLWGRGCDVDALTEIARRRGLKLMFDAAHAFGCTHKGRMVGSFGDAEVFSFHATKFLNSFEGGAVVTNDDELAGKIRLMKNFGFKSYDEVVYIGINGKMTEVAAAMGLTSLESMDDFIRTNIANYRRYCDGLRGVPGVRVVGYDEREKSSYQYVILEIDAAQARLSRDQLMKVLHAEQVLARRYFYPGAHRMEPYRSYFPHADLLLPQTLAVSERVLSLPTGTAVDGATIDRVTALIRFAVAHGPEIAARMEGRMPPGPSPVAEGRLTVDGHGSGNSAGGDGGGGTLWRWKKMGHIFDPRAHRAWAGSHAQVPTVLVLPDVLRIYYADRTPDNRSFTTFLDVDRADPSRVVYTHKTSILPPGRAGTFDDDGVMPAYVMEHDGRVWLYYTGWNRRVTVPFHNATGLAVSDDGGRTFARKFDGPVLDRAPLEPYIAVTPCLLKEGGGFRMWYSSGVDWVKVGGKLEAVYVIKHATSDDGVNWRRDGAVAVPPRHAGEAFAHPFVVKDGDLYRMWYCFRDSEDFRDGSGSYRIGYAESRTGGTTFERKDDEAGIALSPDARDWDSTMIGYPYIVDVGGRTLMFYNGNGFGQTGFGYARLERP